MYCNFLLPILLYLTFFTIIIIIIFLLYLPYNLQHIRSVHVALLPHYFLTKGDVYKRQEKYTSYHCFEGYKFCISRFTYLFDSIKYELTIFLMFSDVLTIIFNPARSFKFDNTIWKNLLKYYIAFSYTDIIIPFHFMHYFSEIS